jgi:hypothetical protein
MSILIILRNGLVQCGEEFNGGHIQSGAGVFPSSIKA